jgi:hypothetical protein
MIETQNHHDIHLMVPEWAIMNEFDDLLGRTVLAFRSLP